VSDMSVQKGEMTHFRHQTWHRRHNHSTKRASLVSAQRGVITGPAASVRLAEGHTALMGSVLGQRPRQVGAAG
jgi:hypothetical protein